MGHLGGLSSHSCCLPSSDDSSCRVTQWEREREKRTAAAFVLVPSYYIPETFVEGEREEEEAAIGTVAAGGR